VDSPRLQFIGIHYGGLQKEEEQCLLGTSIASLQVVFRTKLIRDVPPAHAMIVIIDWFGYRELLASITAKYRFNDRSVSGIQGGPPPINDH
jgi:hypothetical protein